MRVRSLTPLSNAVPDQTREQNGLFMYNTRTNVALLVLSREELTVAPSSTKFAPESAAGRLALIHALDLPLSGR